MVLLRGRRAICPLLTALLLILAACAGPAASPSPTAPASAPTPTEQPSMPGPTDEGPASCTPPDLCPGTLAPGEYLTDTLGPTLTFTVGEGWEADVDIPEVGLSLYQGTAGAPQALSLTKFSGEVFAEACNSADQIEEIEQSAEAFMGWLRAREGIEAGEPTETTLGGQPAIQVDLTTTLPDACTEPMWIWLWVLPVVGDFHFNDDEQARVIAADVGDTTIVVVVEAFPGVDYDAFLADAMGVIDSMVIEP